VRRLRLAVPLFALLLVVAALAAQPASAADGRAQARAEIAQARVLLDRAVHLTREGKRDEAYDAARSAYLDHFERAEVPLRLRNPNLVLDLEFRFAELRDGIRHGDSAGKVEATAVSIREGLRSVDRTLSDPGFAAPFIAFLFAFTILFREGVECVLLLAILLGALEAGRARGYRKPLGLGVLAAVGLSIATWIAAAVLIDVAPVERELLEGATALLAVVVLFFVTFWLVQQLEHRRRMEFMRARIAGAVAAGSAGAFAMLGFTAVYREGFETALFYQALVLFAQGLLEWVVLGIVAAVVALAAVAFAILRLGKRLPLKPMLMTGATLLILLSVAFAGNAVRSLQEGDFIRVTPVDAGWARLPVFLAELTGIHPTREGLFVQAALLAVYVTGAGYVFAWKPARRRIAETRAA
jgi:high-affinity iron transporter